MASPYKLGVVDPISPQGTTSTHYLSWLVATISPKRFIMGKSHSFVFPSKDMWRKNMEQNCRRHGGIRAHAVFFYYNWTCWQIACARVMFQFIVKIMLYTFT